jgi:hypothetical protein
MKSKELNDIHVSMKGLESITSMYNVHMNIHI